MVATWDSFLLLYGLKVSCVRWAGVLGDEWWLCVPNVLPVHVMEERVTLEVLNSILPQTHLGVTDQPVKHQRKMVRGSSFMTIAIVHYSLVPRPPLFLVFQLVCVQYNTRKQKSGEKWERPGNTYHVNDVWWMRCGHRGGGVCAQITY